MKKVRFFISFLLVLLIVFSTSIITSATNFSDISNHWAKIYIEKLAYENIVSGTSSGKFNPNSNLTRADAIVILGKIEKIIPDSHATNKFTDVKKSAYYYGYVAWATNKGIVSGTSNTTFSPNSYITREQLATMISSYSSKCNKSMPSNKSKTTYADNRSISSWAVTPVYNLQQAGIMIGSTGNKFNPKLNITRAESATALCKFMMSSCIYKSGSATPPVPTKTQNDINNAEAKYNSLSLAKKALIMQILLDTQLAAKIGSKALSISWPNAAKSLDMFLANKGGNALTDFNVVGLMSNNNSSQYKDLLYVLDQIIIAAECHSTLNVNRSLSSREEDGFQTTKENSGTDWYLALGYYRFWTGCTVKQTSSTTYTATISFNLKDYYDWAQGGKSEIGVLASELYTLHEAGLSRNYHASGKATIKMTWSSGQLATTNQANISIK